MNDKTFSSMTVIANKIGKSFAEDKATNKWRFALQPHPTNKNGIVSVMYHEGAPDIHYLVHLDARHLLIEESLFFDVVNTDGLKTVFSAPQKENIRHQLINNFSVGKVVTELLESEGYEVNPFHNDEQKQVFEFFNQ